MSDPADSEDAIPSPEELDDALAAFWRGSSIPLDRLLSDEDDVSLSSVLADVIDTLPNQCLAGPMNESYTISREIGRGGMGLVYEARQERTGRNVAIKIIQHVRPSDEGSMQLFRREVEILAGLKHPYIATLHDAGQTPDSAERAGQPFFVMELVEGQPLTRWTNELEESDLSQRDKLNVRLRLFCQICEAIAYAHQRGVIHRDLKPGNILVTGEGVGRCTPKILDFGLAALSTDPASNGNRKCVGTPAYMSPEQREGRIDEIDTRSDVYSLGIILHELLTGRRPGQPPGRMPRKLNPDLESILSKALQHDRAARYQSASALADDVQRFLTNLPVLARSWSPAYQLRKLVTRHKLSSSLVMLLAAACLVFVAIVLYQSRQLARERDLANAERVRAQQVSAYLTGMFDSIDPQNVGTSVSVRDILDRASAELAGTITTDQQVRASLHDTIGRGYMALHVFDKSQRHLSAAFESKKTIYGENHPACAESLHLLGNLALMNHDRAGGTQLLTRAYEIRKQLCDGQSLQLAESICDMALLARDAARYAEAAQLYRQALAIHRQNGENSKITADILRRLGVVLVASGLFEQAIPALNEALTIQQATLGKDHLEVARTLTDIIEIHEHYAEFALAQSLCREQVRILRKAYPEGHKDLAIAISELAILTAENSAFDEAEQLFLEAMIMEQHSEDADALTANNYGAFLREQGRYDEADQLARHVATMWQIKHDHPGAAYAAQNLAAVLLERGCVVEGEALYQRAATIWFMLFAEDNPKIANALIGLGRIYESRGEYSTAESCFRHAARIRTQRLGPMSPLTAQASIHLARVLQREHREESLELAENALMTLYSIYGQQHALIAWAKLELAGMYLNAGMSHEARRFYEDTIAIENSLHRDRHPNMLAARRGLDAATSDLPSISISRTPSWP